MSVRIDGLQRILGYAVLSVRHACARPRLARVPEASAVTADWSDVLDYDRALSTLMALPYALSIDLLHRALPPRRPGARPARSRRCTGPSSTATR